ncbi:cytochrome P450 [Allonocardiopsis opalescens]|uniref:Cytochrome P450 n=1 Tax=Allonocardiopsis opalescens TaxID=1144618 RepID=A0A2T0QEZ3_9ACTN|nr:cytochrome P450 [Allonocardiopsis opalescens]PRY02465.1 cytochrome P450 [Allonocardiopsis opalescens]
MADRPGPRPPGPRGDRWSGNFADYAVDPLGFLSRCAAEFGDVVLLGEHNVLVVHPDEVERILVDRDRSVVKDRPNLRRRAHTGFPRAMMNSEGGDWLRKRRRLQPVFRPERLAALAAGAEAEVDRTVAGWRDGELLDIHPEMARLALTVASTHLLGASAGEAAESVQRAVEAIMRLTATPMRLPAWFPSPVNLALRRSLAELDRNLDAIIARPSAGPGHDTVLGLLKGADPPLDPAEIHDELATLLMSGYETTAEALTWLWYLVGTHPGVDRRLSAEAGDPAGAYLDAVVKEVMRLYPPAWVTSRETAAPVELGGYPVPAGTTVTVSQWVTHRDERWYAAPLVFDPARWLDGGPPHRYAYFPFGGGPRGCIGASMALREIAVITAALRSRVRFELVEPDGVRPRPALTLQPRGVRAVVRKLPAG